MYRPQSAVYDCKLLRHVIKQPNNRVKTSSISRFLCFSHASFFCSLFSHPNSNAVQLNLDVGIEYFVFVLCNASSLRDDLIGCTLCCMVTRRSDDNNNNNRMHYYYLGGWTKPKWKCRWRWRRWMRAAYTKMITNRLGFERVARMCAANRKREKLRRRENYEHIIQSTWPFGLYLRIDLCLPFACSNRCATRFSFTNKR